MQRERQKCLQQSLAEQAKGAEVPPAGSISGPFLRGTCSTSRLPLSLMSSLPHHTHRGRPCRPATRPLSRSSVVQIPGLRRAPDVEPGMARGRAAGGGAADDRLARVGRDGERGDGRAANQPEISPSAGAAGMVSVPVAKVPAGVSTSVEVAFAGVMVKPVVGVCTT